MKFITIEKLKNHLNIDDFFNEDNEYITYLADVAYMVIEKHTDNNLQELAENNGGELPAPIVHAILLYVGDMYRNRESVAYTSVNEIPFSYDYLLSLYKNYNGEVK